MKNVALLTTLAIAHFFLASTIAHASSHHQNTNHRLVTRATACTQSIQCSSTYFCSSGKCTKKQANGGACTKNVGCTSGLCFDSTCLGTTARPLSAPCTASTQCTSGYCSHSICAAKRSNGKACYKNVGCKSGLCNVAASTCQATAIAKAPVTTTTAATTTTTSTSTPTSQTTSKATSASTSKSTSKTTSSSTSTYTSSSTSSSQTKTKSSTLTNNAASSQPISTSSTATSSSTTSSKSSSRTTSSSSTTTTSSSSSGTAAGTLTSTTTGNSSATTTTSTSSKSTFTYVYRTSTTPKPLTGTMLSTSTQSVAALPTVSGTLLPNGDFASGALSPYNSSTTGNGTTLVVAAISRNSANDAAVSALNVSGATSLSYNMSSIPGFKVGSSYALNFLSAVVSMNRISDAPKTSDLCTLSVTNEDNNNTMVAFSYTSFKAGSYASGSWHPSTYEVLDGDAVWSINFVCDYGIEGTFYLDQVTYSALNEGKSAYDSTTDLISNGDFADDTLRPWIVSVSKFTAEEGGSDDDQITAQVLSDASTAYSGSHYVQLDISDGGNLTLTAPVDTSSPSYADSILRLTMMYRVLSMNYTDTSISSTQLPSPTCAFLLSSSEGDTTEWGPLDGGYFSSDVSINRIPQSAWSTAGLTFEAGVTSLSIELQCLRGVQATVVLDRVEVSDISDT